MTLPHNCVPFQRVHAQFVAERLRDDEREQFAFLTGKPYDALEAAQYMIDRHGPRCTVLGPDGLPAVCGGYSCVEPNVWQSWMFGTQDGWCTSWRSITKASRWMARYLFDTMHAKELRTLVLRSRKRTINWYERGLGLTLGDVDGPLATYVRAN